MTLPKTTLIRRYDTHRLIPSKYGETDESVLADLADDDEDLRAIFDLDNATNDRLFAENDRLPSIGVHELVFGVPKYRVINAAYCHPHPLGGRFNGPERGAWYAAFEVETAQAEVAHHKWIELSEVGWTEEEVTYDDYLADFSAEFHDIRRDKRFLDCLALESYEAAQRLAERLLRAGSLGVIYPSVRRRRGTCLACFRPALVTNVRKAATYRFRWSGDEKPAITIAGRRRK